MKKTFERLRCFFKNLMWTQLLLNLWTIQKNKLVFRSDLSFTVIESFFPSFKPRDHNELETWKEGLFKWRRPRKPEVTKLLLQFDNYFSVFVPERSRAGTNPLSQYLHHHGHVLVRYNHSDVTEVQSQFGFMIEWTRDRLTRNLWMCHCTGVCVHHVNNWHGDTRQRVEGSR